MKNTLLLSLSCVALLGLASCAHTPDPSRADPNAGWTVLFRSSDPSLWNTHAGDSTSSDRFSRPVASAPQDLAYLRMVRMDTCEQDTDIRDIDIRAATFGTGTHTADVTDRVIHLLQSDPAGFSARADTLGVDPLPYSNKCLIIDYYYKGKPCRFAVVGQQHVSYKLLLKKAGN